MSNRYIWQIESVHVYAEVAQSEHIYRHVNKHFYKHSIHIPREVEQGRPKEQWERL